MSGRPAQDPSLQQESVICAQCGACRAVCPTFRTLGWESSSPRGRISVLKTLTRDAGRVQGATEEQVMTLCQCTLCGACGQACAALIDTRDLWLRARSALVREGKAVSQFSRLADALNLARNIGAFDNDSRLAWAEDLDEEFWPVELDDAEGALDSDGLEVLYFVGCVASFYPRASQVALAFSEVLGTAGVRFASLGGQEWCCGFPLMASGHADEASAFRQHNIKKILAAGVHQLVMTCPSCYHTYAHYLGEELKLAGVQVLHASQLLLKLIDDGRLRPREWQAIVTYHDPCDLGRNSGVFEEPREIVRRLSHSFVELGLSGESAACCGGGGNLQSVDQNLVDQIADARVDEVVAVGAEVVVSACQQCEQVLESALRRRGLQTKVLDLSEFVLQCMT